MSVAVDTNILPYAVKETHLADLEALAYEIPRSQPTMSTMPTP
ncbi:MAG TPA: hypothetical protein VMG63_06825 [Terriglobia bacterium]|nr:hypothetical protein [Terriglobia bacterium]